MNAYELADVTAHGLEMIERIVKVLSSAHASAVTPKEALDKLEQLHQQILADRAAADQAVDEKFGSSR